jgi:hypothetical protein
LKGANSAVIFDYEVTNDGGILFADEFDRLGGVDTLGYPASYRFELDGFTYQVTQRALLQWRSNIGVAYLGNIFEMLEHAGLDQWLLESKGIPLPIKDDGSNGDWNKARETRLSWLTNEQIKAKFLANPNPDAISDWNVDSAINLYGLPMSMPEKHGPFISQRFQRVAFQLWVDEVAGSPAPGTVIGVLAGDLLKEAGLVPPEGLNVAERPVVVVAPAPAPAPATSQPSSKPKPKPTARPQATAVPDTTPPAAEAKLASLSLSGVTLSPGFSGDTTGYTASVATNVANTTVTATASSEDATIVYKLNDVVDEDGTIDLATGANVIKIEVTNGDASATYTVTVTRAAVVAVGATLSALSLSGITLSPAFASATLGYTASVVASVDDTTVTATAAEGATAVITVGDQTVESGATADLVADGETTITVTVTAGDATNVYTVKVTRGPAAADATLNQLALEGLTLDFSKNTFSYSLTVPAKIGTTTVTATPGQSDAVVVFKVGGSVVSGATPTVSLAFGPTVINVEITSTDTKTTETYTITLTRLTSAGPSDSTLESLSVVGVGVKLVPSFNPAIRQYTADVPFGTVGALPVTVTFEANGAGATPTLLVDGSDGSTPVQVGVGRTIIKVRVQPSDSDLPASDYTITLTRRERTKGTDASLSALSLVSGDNDIALDKEFKADETSYNARVANQISSVTVTATVTDDNSVDPSNTGDVAGVASEPVIKLGEDDDGTVSLLTGNNHITVEVTAEDGTTKRTYRITVRRLGSSGPEDPSLETLTLTDDSSPPATVDLKPDFDPESTRTSYTASVAFEVNQVTVAATLNVTGATFETRVGDTVISDNVVAVAAVGTHTIVVRGKSAVDDGPTKDYTIVLTKLAKVDSNDATLETLELSDVTLAFARETYSYTATVANDVTSTNVTATKNHDAASDPIIKLNGEVADGAIDLADDKANVITIEVTAEDGTTKQTYTVTVTRTPLSSDTSLKTLRLATGTGQDVEDVILTSTGANTYTASVTVAEVTLTAVANDDDDAVTVMVQVDGGVEVTLDDDGVGTLVTTHMTTYLVEVIVTAADLTSTTTYTIMLHSNPAPSS